jgi:hypothetical protein
MMHLKHQQQMIRTFDRRVSATDEHIRKYPLRLAFMPQNPAPLSIGISWYSDFDNPVKDKDGKYWIGKNPKSLGQNLGGHCVCVPHKVSADLLSWYRYYDQGEQGACVGFGSSRMMSLLNRKMYDARWLWNEAKKIDEWPDTNPGDNEGTSVRAAMDVLRNIGHVPKRSKTAKATDGIAANRWATNIDDLFGVLQNEEYKRLGALPILNSWGNFFPRVVWMPCETHDRLLREDGEYSMITDL